MDISGDVARYSMEMAAARVSSAVQVSVLRNVCLLYTSDAADEL